MKTNSKYNKSEIMTEAWFVYRNRETFGWKTFGECLKSVWAKFKTNLSLTNPKDVAGLIFKENRVVNVSYSKHGSMSQSKQMNKSSFIFRYIAKNSKTFHADIATKAMNSDYILSNKQVWCLSYEYAKLAS